MKTILIILWFCFTAQVVGAQPAEVWQWVDSLPNGGGTLYLTFCTKAGWPCLEKRHPAMGQICYQTYAEDAAISTPGSFPFTEYTSWRCTDFHPTKEAREQYGYAEGGKAFTAKQRAQQKEKEEQWKKDNPCDEAHLCSSSSTFMISPPTGRHP